MKVIKRGVFSPVAEVTHTNTVADYPLHKLFESSLYGNEISDIEPNSFFGLNRLQWLSLQFNQLSALHRQTFVGLPLLFAFHFTGNKIELIEDGAFEFELPSLQWPQLYENHLRQLSDAPFAQVPKLGIVLGKNRIDNIDLAAFEKLPELMALTLGRSGLLLPQ